MCKYIKNYLEKIDLTYYEFKKNDFLKNKKHINIKKENNLKNTEKYDYIIISSYEYQSHIKKKIFLLVKKAKIFEIYDNCSRSLVDTYFINDLKMKKKYSKMGKEQNYYQLLDD